MTENKIVAGMKEAVEYAQQRRPTMHSDVDCLDPVMVLAVAKVLRRRQTPSRWGNAPGSEKRAYKARAEDAITAIQAAGYCIANHNDLPADCPPARIVEELEK